MAATYDVFLVLRPFRHNAGELRLLLAPLAHLGRTHLAGADGFYSDELDTALVALRLHAEVFARMGHEGIRQLVDGTGLPVLIPCVLEPAARERFLHVHLPRYTTYVQLYPHGCESVPVAERVVLALAEHFDPSAPAPRPVLHDLDGELPLPLPVPWPAHRITPPRARPAARPAGVR